MSSSAKTAEELIQTFVTLKLPRAAVAIERQEKENHKTRYGARDIISALIQGGYAKTRRLWVLKQFGYEEGKDSIITTLKNEGLI